MYDYDDLMLEYTSAQNEADFAEYMYNNAMGKVASIAEELDYMEKEAMSIPGGKWVADKARAAGSWAGKKWNGAAEAISKKGLDTKVKAEAKRYAEAAGKETTPGVKERVGSFMYNHGKGIRNAAAGAAAAGTAAGTYGAYRALTKDNEKKASLEKDAFWGMGTAIKGKWGAGRDAIAGYGQKLMNNYAGLAEDAKAGIINRAKNNVGSFLHNHPNAVLGAGVGATTAGVGGLGAGGVYAYNQYKTAGIKDRVTSAANTVSSKARAAAANVANRAAAVKANVANNVSGFAGGIADTMAAQRMAMQGVDATGKAGIRRATVRGRALPGLNKALYGARGAVYSAARAAERNPLVALGLASAAATGAAAGVGYGAYKGYNAYRKR